MAFTEESGRRISILLAVAILAFGLGVFSSKVWSNRYIISEACAEFMLNWQD
jgi:hypothetical protein